jgi:hypothetical protein
MARSTFNENVMQIIRVLSALALVASFVEPSKAQIGTGVPVELVDAAGRDPETFAANLAEARVPAGVEIRQADRPRIASRTIKLSRERLVPLDRVTESFNARHSDYQAQLVNRMVTIRPTLKRATYLEQQARVSIHVRGILPAMRRLFASLDATLDAPGGEVGSLLGGMDMDRGESISIDVDPDGKRVLDALAAIATSAPGHAWLVVTDATEPVAIIKIGFVHGNGSTTELPVVTRPSLKKAAWIAPRGPE